MAHLFNYVVVVNNKVVENKELLFESACEAAEYAMMEILTWDIDKHVKIKFHRHTEEPCRLSRYIIERDMSLYDS